MKILCKNGIESLRQDGFKVTLKRTLNYIRGARESNITNIKSEIEFLDRAYVAIQSPAVKIVSFDFFDTLFIRPGLEPTDVLKMMILPGFTNSEFIKMHQYADNICYAEKGPNVTLWDIYKKIGSTFDISEDVIRKAYKDELSIEMQYLRPNYQVQILFQNAIKLGKKVIITTDTYFSEEYLIEILRRNGIDGLFKLYCSCSLGFRKDSGDLFKYILNDLNITANEMVHIGDNRYSDYEIAQSLGITAIHYISPSQFFKNSELGRFQPYFTKKLDNSILWGLYSNIHQKSTTGKTFSTPYSFGLFLGPCVLSFTKWIISEMNLGGYDRLLLCYRDGYLIEKVLEEASKYVPLNFNYEEIHLPRIIRHPFYSKSGGLLRSLDELEVNVEMSVSDFIKYRIYATDSELFNKALNAFEKIDLKENDSIGDISRIYPIISELNVIFKDSCKKPIEIIDQYCKDKVGKGNCAIFDIGYRGSVHAFLKEMIGLDIPEYQMMSNYTLYTNKYQNGVKNFTFYDKKTLVDSLVPEILIENAISIQEPEMIGIDFCNGEPHYIFNGSNATNEYIESVQRGIMDYVSYSLEIFGSNIMNLNFDQSLEFSMIHDLLKYPSLDFALSVKNMYRPDSSQIKGSVNDDAFDYWFRCRCGE